MPTVTPYAEVLGQEKVSKSSVGIPHPDGLPLTGRPLGEFRAKADNNTFLMPISERDKEELQLIYESNQDASCLELKDKGYVAVPLDHLRDLDDATRVRVGYEFRFSHEESDILPKDPEFNKR
jgi:hypothetical protein